jgi:predicted CopG family antitoxin
MGQKTISIRESVYKKLQKRKPKSLSYSDYLDKLMDEKAPKDIRELSQFKGVLEDNTSDEWDNILIGIYEDRKKKPTRLVNLDD